MCGHVLGHIFCFVNGPPAAAGWFKYTDKSLYEDFSQNSRQDHFTEQQQKKNKKTNHVVWISLFWEWDLNECICETHRGAPGGIVCIV